MYKIFVNEKELIIASTKSIKSFNYDLYIKYENKKTLSDVILKLESNVHIAKSICIYGKNASLIWKDFYSRYKLIKAAGGIVKNEKNEILFIFRRGKWDLPKGKLEKNETIKECAIREVEEECGISGLKILKELPSTYHTYFIKEKPIIKRSYWFAMTVNGNQKLVPQTEEDITDIKWIKPNGLKKVLRNTYSSIEEVLRYI
ncbi:MAG: hypothetical protein A3K10_01610 [Bacteroidetes bacterium RIFCSPLOWO2_12_FULL_31_6]|nr:MAG: hypothetical protein A3K10_01610 [Bacteroidetes bacterium RIFCSPLOWO2_12_FULL_31_6]